MDLTIETKLPGEGLIQAAIEFAGKIRETQSEDVRKFWDMVAVEMHANWRQVWVSAGLWKPLPELDAHIEKMREKKQ
jgi:hypothetical protein